MSKVIIAPSLLSSDFSRLSDELSDIKAAGADWVHVDVMDGHFVPNLTIGPPVVSSLRAATDMPLDVHLMIENPENFVEAFASAGADLITIHVESTQDPAALLRLIRKLGCKAGITLRPRTGIEAIMPYLDLVDLVLVMTVEPGFGGQKFMSDQISKIEAIKNEAIRKNQGLYIEVDGGVDEKTAPLCIQAGANVLVSGSYIFKHKDNYSLPIQKLRGSK